MDKVYHDINTIININGYRQVYTALYDSVKKTIIDGLKKNILFPTLFFQEKLSGSYADNLKITRADEFDLVMRFKFPAENSIIILPDEENKGNVFIDLTGVLDVLRDDLKYVEMYNFLKNHVNDRGYLLENKFQSWFQSCITKVLNNIDKKVTHKNIEYKLFHTKEGPAHTISVQKLDDNVKMFSIDFVPGFVFSIDKYIAKRKPNGKFVFWEAIPRPLKCAIVRDNPSFRTSYTDWERQLIEGKGHLKQAIKIMKKFRDNNPSMTHLKSYYIKTIFLWMLETKDEQFWNKSISVIMHEVFKEFEKALQNKQIRFYWDDELNMLNTLKQTQVVEMYHIVRRAVKLFNSYPSKISVLKLYLSDTEINYLGRSTSNLLADCFKETSKSYFYYSCFCLYFLVVCYQIYKTFFD